MLPSPCCASVCLPGRTGRECLRFGVHRLVMRCCDPGFKSGPLTTFSSHLQVLHCRELGMNAITVLEQYSELDLLLQVGWQTEGWWRAHMFPCAADAGSPARRTSAALSPTPAPAAVPFACQPQASERLGVRPSIGIRAKLTTRHQGHWGSTSGDKAKVCGWGGGGGGGGGGVCAHALLPCLLPTVLVAPAGQPAHSCLCLLPPHRSLVCAPARSWRW